MTPNTVHELTCDEIVRMIFSGLNVRRYQPIWRGWSLPFSNN